MNLLRGVLLLSGLALATPGLAATSIWITDLSGDVEVPPVPSPGFGTARLDIDSTAMTVRIRSGFGDLLSPTSVAHIHCCTAVPFLAPAGVAIQPPTLTGFPAGVTSGTYDHTFDLTNPGTWNPAFITNNGGTTDGALAALLTGLAEGRAYFNIHTTLYPGGEIAGFFVVPLPGAAWLFISALMVTSLLRRRFGFSA